MLPPARIWRQHLRLGDPGVTSCVAVLPAPRRRRHRGHALALPGISRTRRSSGSREGPGSTRRLPTLIDWTGAFPPDWPRVMTAANPPAPPASDAPDPRRWRILAVLGLAQLMVVLDATIVNIALPTAQRDLHFTTVDRQWVVTAYALAFGSLLLLGGRVSAIVGRKVTFLGGLIGFAAASAVGGAAISFTHAGDRPRLPGCVRRVHGALRAVPADHDVRRDQGPGPGVRRVRRHRRRGRGHRAAARRDADRVPVLALVPVREPVLRRRGRYRRRHPAPPSPAQRRAAQAGHPGRGVRLGRHVLHRLRLLERRHPRLGQAVHLGLPGRRAATAAHLRLVGVARPGAAAAAAHRAGPEPGRRLPVHPDRGLRDLRHLPVRHVLHAADPGLLPGDHRAGLPAHGRDDHDRVEPVQHRADAAARAQAA